jgi:GNAT superfamily N-acetyltransferase
MTLTQVEVRPLAAEDWPLLVQMYDSFDPIGDALGLPPPNPARRRAWLEGLREGVNFVAYAEGRIAGHLVLMPSEVVAEMAVFVHQDYRRHGVAWTLAERAVEEARHRGLRSLWVLISSSNVAARMGLRKFGFRTVWEKLGEVQMVYRL